MTRPSDLDRLDADAGEVLAVALGQAIALAALVLEDADLRAGRVALDLGQDLRAGDERIADLELVAADEEHLAELDLVARFAVDQLDVDDVARRDAKLL